MNQQYRVLVVDDEPMILRGLSFVIPWDKLGLQVVGKASNGEEALWQINKLEPHIVITDIRMPVMNGLELLKRVMTERPSMVVVLLSGYGEFENLREALRYGAFDYLLKPVCGSELEQTMRRAKSRLDEMQGSEREFLHQSVQAVTELVRERLICSMLEGTEKPYDRLYWLREWELEHPYFLLLIALDDAREMKQWDRSERKLWNFAVNNVLAELGKSQQLITVFPFRSGEWVMLLQEISQEQIEEIAEHIIVCVKTFTKLSCSIGISKPCRGIDSLHASYRSAQHALMARFTGGRESVYMDADAHLLHESGPTGIMGSQLDVWETRLAAAVSSYDRDAVTALLGEWKGELLASGAKQPDAVALMIELMVGVSKRLADLFGLPLPGLSALISEMPICVTLEEMNELMASALAEYQELVSKQVQREKETSSVRKALQYADKYFHQDVSIDEVAEHVGLSNSHFCVLFKKETGYTFLEYLTKQRIEWACSMLKNTDTRIHNVSHMVGYQDPKYFSQVFKKLVGMTPSEYRTAFKNKGGIYEKPSV
ncbi:response regulator [Xylanibacillus composti]|uniref:AraC family transcriptional regulator n=1 Tax=Xylanibacillus composti TaxID=1572762 RepID=A0A8J4GY61_9BACL|nr:response regulator [Xylanibacillus composti]GIQ67348.1 AraC family transcriptional regulator [Xylanibacillus composti]